MSDMTAQLAQKSKAWPFEEARSLLKRLKGKVPEKGYVLFQTGYGPSGLPHIGTFGEVVRTTMVQRAFDVLCEGEIPTKLLCFSDDMDGFRKIPPQLPQQEMLETHLHKSLTAVPDPFGTHDSFGAHNNDRLKAFLDGFGFTYEFASSTEYYKSGKFDAALLRMLEVYDKVMDIMLPTLGEERRATYSPFLPVSPKTGRVLQVPMLERDAEAGTVTFEDEDGTITAVPVTGGHVKCQWKPDWALRWHALQVDYEMCGKDVNDSRGESSAICRALGTPPPSGLIYELFLDDEGRKISKTKGNGLSVEEWLRYAPAESLSLFMFQKPKTAKRLFFDVIPKAVDEYLAHAGGFHAQDEKQQLNNPAYHIHEGKVPHPGNGISYKEYPSFSMLLNLASAANADDKALLWGYVQRDLAEAEPDNAPMLDALIGHAVAYYQDFVKPTKKYRAATGNEADALRYLADALRDMDADADGAAIMDKVYEAGRENGYDKSTMRDWFKAIYEVLLGQSQGPRFGTFAHLYGREETIALIEQGLSGAFLEASADA
ncbi:MAG: lysine--tRNA ligase [Alphaproteobacteria bacterium]